MNSNNREPIFAAISFAVVTILSLITSWIGSAQKFTPLIYWLAVIFVALVAAGALVEWARHTEPRKKGTTAPPPSGHKHAPGGARLRIAGFVLAGTAFGLVASTVFFLMIGPGTHTNPDPNIGHPVTVTVASSDGGPAITDNIAVTVTVTQQLPAGDTYWLMTEYDNGFGTVYKAQDQVPSAKGPSHYSISIVQARVYSTRKVYVIEANSTATPTLMENFNNPDSSWDSHRYKLPTSGVETVSNSVTVVKQPS
jgi:hypothetical protein